MNNKLLQEVEIKRSERIRNRNKSGKVHQNRDFLRKVELDQNRGLQLARQLLLKGKLRRRN